jgi:cell division protein FtsA|tara:strand:- start:1291 stop:2586 length:1296 start_codon:yes stop_codon:yes gene_type:complete
MENTINNPESEIIVGLDIGTTKIACFVGQRNEHGKIEILGYGKSKSVGVSRGVVSNIEKTVQSIKLAIKVAEENSGIEIKVVNVGIAGQHIKSLQHRGMITREDTDEEICHSDITTLIDDMSKLVMPPGAQILHVLPQEFTVDSEPGIKDPVGMAGVRLEANFHIITGDIAAARNIVKCISKAGLELGQLVLEPLASSSSVLTEEEKEAGIALVDIGGGTTDIAIFQDGIIRHTAVIPFGGKAISQDISTGCNIMAKQAEKLKCKFGSALAQEMKDNELVCIPGLQGRKPKEISLKNLASIIEARMTEIIEHVHYEIKASGLGDQLIGGIVVTGGGSQMRHITQLFQYVTGLDCRVGYPNEHLHEPPSDTNIPSYSTGVGLVIRGYEVQIASEVIEAGNTKKKKSKGSFMDTFVNSIKDWFEKEEEEHHKQ